MFNIIMLRKSELLKLISVTLNRRKEKKKVVIFEIFETEILNLGATFILASNYIFVGFVVIK